LGEHLNTLLAYVEKLNGLNTDGVEPLAHAVEVPAPMRDDRVTTEANTEALLRHAPAREGDFFSVPKIIFGPFAQARYEDSPTTQQRRAAAASLSP
jgi:aspartyl-tRNA(Asn)/glutamyl-tRNA(Gln) amidotransferase subunit C